MAELGHPHNRVSIVNTWREVKLGELQQTGIHLISLPAMTLTPSSTTRQLQQTSSERKNRTLQKPEFTLLFRCACGRLSAGMFSKLNWMCRLWSLNSGTGSTTFQDVEMLSVHSELTGRLTWAVQSLFARRLWMQAVWLSHRAEGHNPTVLGHGRVDISAPECQCRTCRSGVQLAILHQIPLTNANAVSRQAPGELRKASCFRLLYGPF
jgi:hypothetical protein